MASISHAHLVSQHHWINKSFHHLPPKEIKQLEIMSLSEEVVAEMPSILEDLHTKGKETATLKVF